MEKLCINYHKIGVLGKMHLSLFVTTMGDRRLWLLLGSLQIQKETLGFQMAPLCVWHCESIWITVKHTSNSFLSMGCKGDFSECVAVLKILMAY